MEKRAEAVSLFLLGGVAIATKHLNLLSPIYSMFTNTTLRTLAITAKWTGWIRFCIDNVLLVWLKLKE